MGVETEVVRRIEIYRKVAQKPHLAKVLGKLQGLGEYPADTLQQHYRNTADTFQRGWEEIEARRREKSESQS